METIQEKFFKFYSETSKENDRSKYFEAVDRWEKTFSMKSPFKNYNSFKVSMTKHFKRKRQLTKI